MIEEDDKERQRKQQEEARRSFYGDSKKDDNYYFSNDNPIARALKGIGIAEIVVGIIIGIVLASQDDDAFNWAIAIAWWGSSIVTGIIFIGFSEVVRLLHEINERGKRGH